tara:strand:- start:387 stop:1268 length:882 start_codon:yes stop_codon:yes gene_type:complete
MNRQERRRQAKLNRSAGNRKGLSFLETKTPLKDPNDYSDVTSANNNEVVKLLNDPANGFYVQHKWVEDETAYGGGKTTYSVYGPSLLPQDPNYVNVDALSIREYEAYMERHMNAYIKAFGMVEAQAHNIYSAGEDAGKSNPADRDLQTYDTFDGGAYKLMFGVIEHSYNDDTFESDTPSLKTAVFPMQQFGWEPASESEFQTFGGSVKLNNLQSMVARSNFSTRYISGFNSQRFDNLEEMFHMAYGGKAVKLNWLNQYEEAYAMGRSLYSDNITTIIGDDVTVNAMALHRVFD